MTLEQFYANDTNFRYICHKVVLGFSILWFGNNHSFNIFVTNLT